MENISLLRRIFTGFGISLVITLLLIYLYRKSFESFNNNSKSVFHSLNVLETIEELSSIVKDSETGTGGYIITGDSSFIMPLIYAKDTISGKLEELRRLTLDNPLQQKLLLRLDTVIKAKLQLQLFLVHLKNSGNLKFGYLNLLTQNRQRMEIAKGLINAMKKEETRLLNFRESEVRDSTTYSRIIVTIFSITVISIMILSLFTILFEIRNKKKVQDLLKTVFESSQSGIMSFKAVRDQNSIIRNFELIQTNRQGAAMLNRSTRQILGKYLLDFMPGYKTNGLFDAFVSVTETGMLYRTEVRYNNEDYNVWYRIVAVKLGDGLTVTIDDISNEKGYERELQNSINELKRSNNELEQFAFVASHDLQEPLRKIQSFGDRVKLKYADQISQESKVYIDKMLAAASRMSKLINDLLSFSRLVSTTDPFVKTDLNKIVTDVLVDLELLINQKKAKIEVSPLPEIIAVSSQMSQLFFNLLANSLKFSKPGLPALIKIDAQLFTDKENIFSPSNHNHTEKKVRITIEDNGIGFEPEYADRIFVIFQRLHGKSEYEGTGIGLAICKRIITNHRGKIYTKSNLGEGATFVIELPVSQSEPYKGQQLREALKVS
jgi:signal transduction histidine kinase